MGKKLNEDEIKQLYELYDLGVSKTKIAEKLNKCVATITKYIEIRDGKQTDDEMIGKTFYNLTVLRRAPKREDLASRCIRYECQCSCGKIITINGASLRSGHTRSCGCIRKLNVPYQDLTNQRFGKLVAIKLSDESSEDRHKNWICRCDCGNTIIAKSNCLSSGRVRSCGCVKSWKEKEIMEWLDDNKILYKKEYTFSDLRGKTNPLRFDFGILGENNKLLCLIEYQGEQHFIKDNGWHNEQLVDSDIRKKKYCEENSIDLYEFTKDTNLSEELKRICEKYGYKLSKNN